MPGENEEEIKTFTKDEMTQRINEARAQAAREGKKAVLESLGFENTDALKTFIEDAQAARAAAESETEKRERELAEREAVLVKREAEAAAKTLELVKKNALASLGATGDNLEDAARLLDITADMSGEEIAQAAKNIQDRHPGMFGVKTQPDIPAVNPPARPNLGTKPGDYGAQMAERYFGKKQ